MKDNPANHMVGKDNNAVDPLSVRRRLIVNADDFGQSPGVNRGIIKAHEHGIVSSTSMMVRWPASADAAQYARTHPRLSVGLHLDLGEWIYRDDGWVCLYEVAALADGDAVAAAIASQLQAFRDLIGRDPTHLDSHQHVHRDDPLRTIVINLGRKIGVPVRHFHDQIRYSGNFYGQTGKGSPFPAGISVNHLVDTIAALCPGVTELGCHPGLGVDVESMYRDERAIEVETLCDPRVRQSIDDNSIELCGFDSFRTNAKTYLA